MAVTIRLARDDETSAVAELYLRARAAAVPAIPPSVHDDDDVRRWVRTTLLPSTEVWVADEDGGVIGFLALADGWIEQLYLEPSRTSEGIGSQLVDHAKARQPDGLDLWAFQSNVGARRFYERHGFVAVAETDGDNEEGEPDVRYHWPTVAG